MDPHELLIKSRLLTITFKILFILALTCLSNLPDSTLCSALYSFITCARFLPTFHASGPLHCHFFFFLQCYSSGLTWLHALDFSSLSYINMLYHLVYLLAFNMIWSSFNMFIFLFMISFSYSSLFFMALRCTLYTLNA